MKFEDYSPEGLIQNIQNYFSRLMNRKATAQGETKREPVRYEPEPTLNMNESIKLIRSTKLVQEEITLAPTYASILLDSINDKTPAKNIAELIRKLEQFIRQVKATNVKIKGRLKPIADLEKSIFDDKSANWDDPNIVVAKTRKLADMVKSVGNFQSLYPSSKQLPFIGHDGKDSLKYPQPVTFMSPNQMELNKIYGLYKDLVDLWVDTEYLPHSPVIDLTDPPYRGLLHSQYKGQMDYDYDGNWEEDLLTIEGIYNGDDVAETNSQYGYDYLENVLYSQALAHKLIEKIVALTSQVNGIEPVYTQR